MRESIPELRQQKFGSTNLRCVMLSQPLEGNRTLPLGLFPTYCAENDKLLISEESALYSVVARRIGTFRERSVPVKLEVSDRGKVVLTGSVDLLSGYTSDSSKEDTTGLVKSSPTQVRVSGGVIAGSKISGAGPVYPEAALRNRVHGSVVLEAKIGTEGRIHRLRVVSSPDVDLSLAALAAVQQWMYTPYSLKGTPTEVTTTITVNFNLN